MVFLDEILVRPLANGKDWMLRFKVDYETNDSRIVHIPRGFVSDFASIPKFFRRMYQPATGKHRRAAIVHDYLYRTPEASFTKEESDNIFVEIMKADGVSKFNRYVLHKAVAIFGGGSYMERT